jgi:hypothetical protein
MDTAVVVAVISGLVAVITPTFAFYLTKARERAADRHQRKFEQYQELLAAIGSIVGTDATPEGHRRFAAACNTLNLMASVGVIRALHGYQDEIRVSNPHKSDERHDALLGKLVWEMRKDLGISATRHVENFSVRLWCSGTGPLT